MNGIRFADDNLLTTTGEQTITGRKTFDLRTTPPLRVDQLELDGQLNGVRIGEYLRRSVSIRRP